MITSPACRTTVTLTDHDERSVPACRTCGRVLTVPVDGDTTTAEPVRNARAPESGSIDLVIHEDGECEVITESDTVTYLDLPASDAAPTGKPPSNRDQTIAMEHDDSS